MLLSMLWKVEIKCEHVSAYTKLLEGQYNYLRILAYLNLLNNGYKCWDLNYIDILLLNFQQTDEHVIQMISSCSTVLS